MCCLIISDTELKCFFFYYETVEFVQKPGIFYPIEDETLAVTCSAEGPVSKVVFLRQDELGIRFVEMTNTQRVYTTNETEGSKFYW